MEVDLPDSFSPEFVTQLKNETIAYCLANGIVIGSKDNDALACHAPVSLLPQVMKKKPVESCIEIGPIFNRLYDAIGRDDEFLLEVFEPLAKVDEFIANLLRVFRESLKSPHRQSLSLMLTRSDYMFHEDHEKIQAKQIEMNTISVAFAGLSSKITELHRYMLQRNFVKTALNMEYFNVNHVKTNQSLVGFTKGLAQGLTSYCEKYNIDVNDAAKKPIVVMVIHKNDRNSTDQRLIEYTLFNTYGITLVRHDLGYIREHSTCDAEGRIMLDGQEVGIVYYRSCYTPASLHEKEDVDTVSYLECSRAVKCPSIGHHLAGSKKIQQLLCSKDILCKFITPTEADTLLEYMMPIYPLTDSEESKLLEAKVHANPGEWVLKPQREGGGNNLWAQEMLDALNTMSVEEKQAYILMQRVMPKSRAQALMVEGNVVVEQSISELGIYGTIVSDGTNIVLNETLGTLLRTKKVGVDEGGVATGYSVLDSLCLVDSNSSN